MSTSSVQPAVEAYASNREHLFEELRRLDLLCNRAVALMRRASSREMAFRGLFISEEEVDAITGSAGERRQDGSRRLNQAESLGKEAERLGQMISGRLAATPAGRLRLPYLAWLFDLDAFETQVLTICLAPEIDRKYGKLYAYLQDDVTRRHPSVDLILSLLCPGLDERLTARGRLVPQGKLLRHGLLRPVENAHDPHPGGLSRLWRIDERIAGFLLEQDSPPAQLRPFLSMISGGPKLQDLMLANAVLRRLQAFADILERELGDEAAGIPTFYFQGCQGAGRMSAASSLCALSGMALLRVDAERLLACSQHPGLLMPILVREARLTSCALYIDRADALTGDAPAARRALESFFDAFQELPCVLFLAADRPWEARRRPPAESFHRLRFPIPDAGLRRRFWEANLRRRGLALAEGEDLETLAVQFRLTPGRIQQAVVEARRTAGEHGRDARALRTRDLQRAARRLSRAKLQASALRIKPLYRWEDIVLPPDTLAQLREMASHARNRRRVFADWGFDRKMSLGKGLSALFTGPSGTGKTMAAEIIANDLGAELYKVDLAGLVSKYIGETEKNLRRIFNEAERSSAMLFFDEADALFGKRSQVKDAHDRYANIEVNYLLQKIEEYEGIVILASNLQKNIDEAFTRRLRFIIEFPFPEAEDRERIWRKVFPEETPLSDDIDYEFLARKLKLTGGHIRGIALHAAFAAVPSGRVSMAEVVRATRRQFQKQGRALAQSDFEDYYELLEAPPPERAHESDS